MTGRSAPPTKKPRASPAPNFCGSSRSPLRAITPPGADSHVQSGLSPVGGEIAVLGVPAQGPGDGLLNRCVVQPEFALGARSVVGVPVEHSSDHFPAYRRL